MMGGTPTEAAQVAARVKLVHASGAAMSGPLMISSSSGMTFAPEKSAGMAWLGFWLGAALGLGEGSTHLSAPASG